MSRTLGRYHLLETEAPLSRDDRAYVAAAEEIFLNDPAVAVFVYRHTHAASLKRVDRRAVINTGTWLKLQEKVPVVLGKLPPVYYPLFRPNYFRILEEDGQLVVYYEAIKKEAPSELTLVQRLLTLTKRKSKALPIPKRTVVSA